MDKIINNLYRYFTRIWNSRQTESAPNQNYLVDIENGVRIIFKIWLSLIASVSKDGRIVEDRALGIYPKSVYALYTSICCSIGFKFKQSTLKL